MASTFLARQGGCLSVRTLPPATDGKLNRANGQLKRFQALVSCARHLSAGRKATRVLLIEDDYSLGEAVHDHIAAEGHAVDWMRRLEDAEAARAGVGFELILLDLNLPDGSGLDFLRAMRRQGDATPVIILTAMDQISWRIDGLNAGADDYLVKPFDLSELSARLAAVARRCSGNPNPLIVLGAIEIDLAHRLVTRDGAPADLTSREWAVLERLLRHPGAVISKSQLEDTLYEFGAEVESNAVEVYVSRLRRKLGQQLITTVRGLGYRVAGKETILAQIGASLTLYSPARGSEEGFEAVVDMPTTPYEPSALSHSNALAPS